MTTRWFFPRVSFIKIACLHTTELQKEGGKKKKPDHWVKQNSAEVSQKVINLFVSLCRLHAEHKPITSRVKEVTKPVQEMQYSAGD